MVSPNLFREIFNFELLGRFINLDVRNQEGNFYGEWIFFVQRDVQLTK